MADENTAPTPALTTHRFDLHMHSFFSPDAADSPEDLIAAAKARGLSGIAITDHDNCEVHEYLRAKGLAREDGMAVLLLLSACAEDLWRQALIARVER